MFGTHAVISSIVSTLEQGPERFYPIGVSLIVDVLVDAVTDCFVFEVHLKASVPTMIVSVNSGASDNLVSDESL
jgi:hypothetical protein